MITITGEIKKLMKTNVQYALRPKEVITPTSYWAAGFAPSAGMRRPGIDMGWPSSWTDQKASSRSMGRRVSPSEHRDPLPERQRVSLEWAVAGCRRCQRRNGYQDEVC